MNNQKKEYFEAFVNELLKWHKSAFSMWLKGFFKPKIKNDLSRSKVLKLLFLWVSKNKEALKIFDDFRAWDLWPVENDIFELMKNNNLDYFDFNDHHPSNLEVKKWVKMKFSDEAQKFAKDTVNFLKKTNSELIKWGASSLTDTTQRWNSWQLTRVYKKNDNFKMDSELILNEQWNFDIY